MEDDRPEADIMAALAEEEAPTSIHHEKELK